MLRAGLWNSIRARGTPSFVPNGYWWRLLRG